MKAQTQKSTFTLPTFIAEELNDFSQELGLKKSHMVSEALAQYFDKLDLDLAVKRSQEIRSGASKTITLDELKKELNIN